MIKVFNPLLLKLKVASKYKNRDNVKSKKVSRRCLAVVQIINNEYRAIININKYHIKLREGNELSNEQLVLPFTKKSLSLYDKTHVWSKTKDKYGHNICVVRNEDKVHFNPGLSTQYDALKENSLISGHIVKINNISYFEYEELVSFNYLSESHLVDVKIDEDKPLFIKR